jgi:hypothetical protein
MPRQIDRAALKKLGPHPAMLELAREYDLLADEETAWSP